MLCHRCGHDVAAGASHCDNCGAPMQGARKRFRPTLNALKVPDLDALPAMPSGLAVGGDIDGRFILKASLGASPLGWRFRARERSSKLDVVIRFIESDEIDLDAARTALEQARRLSQSNIVRTYEVGRHGDRLFVVTERLDGLTLRQVLDLRREKGQRFGLDEIVPIFEQIRDALLHAHRHLPHGGLSPACIHILPTALKIDGFGLAAALPGVYARARVAAGTGSALAPEVRAGRPPSVAGDVYGLGAIVYEMLTGRAFGPDAPPPSVAMGRAADMDDPVDLFVRRATSPDPDARFADVVELAEALAGLLDRAEPDDDVTRRVVAPDLQRRLHDDAPTADVITARAAVEPAADPSDDLVATDEVVIATRPDVDDVSEGTTSEQRAVATDEVPTHPRHAVRPPPLPGGPTPVVDRPSQRLTDPMQQARRSGPPPPIERVPIDAPPQRPASSAATDPEPSSPPSRPDEPAPAARGPAGAARAGGPPPVPGVPAAAADGIVGPAGGRPVGAPVAGRGSVQSNPGPAPLSGAPIGPRSSVQSGRPAAPVGAPIGARGSVQGVGPGAAIGAPIGARASAQMAGPSVLVDPAYGRLDTQPPADDMFAEDDTGTVRVRAPAPPRPWFIRSNIGFGLTLLAIIGGVAVGAWYLIERSEPEPDAGPRVIDAQRRSPAARPAAPPEVVMAHPVEDAAVPLPPPAVSPPPPAGPTAAAPTPAKPPPAERPAPRRAPDPVAATPSPERSTPAAPERPEPAEPAEPAAAAPAPEPVRPEPIAAAPAEPAEPDPPAAPAAPDYLECPRGMTLILHREFPRSGRKKGRLVTPEAMAAARDGQAYCIDTFEYPGRGKTPRTSVTLAAAKGLCANRGRRLCTDAEWRRACVGRKGAAFPYGRGFDPGRCNTEDAEGEERAVAPGGRFRKCVSMRGVFDMSGNVAEWTADQTVRGGDYASADEDAACNAGGRRAPGSARASIGFRCCADFD